MPLMVNNGDEGGPWEPPQKPSLVGAWVAGLSGPVAKLGTWAGQYGTTYAATLVADAHVTDGGLALDGLLDEARSGVPSVGVSDRSLSAWVQLTAITQFAPVIGTGVLSGGSGCGVFAYANRTIGAQIRQAGTLVNATSTTTIALNGWHHIAATFDRSANASLYVDGELAATSDISALVAANLQDNDPFHIGTNHSSNPFFLNGLVDCAYVWDSVLSADDIAALYTTDPYRRGNL